MSRYQFTDLNFIPLVRFPLPLHTALSHCRSVIETHFPSPLQYTARKLQKNTSQEHTRTHTDAGIHSLCDRPSPEAQSCFHSHSPFSLLVRVSFFATSPLCLSYLLVSPFSTSILVVPTLTRFLSFLLLLSFSPFPRSNRYRLVTPLSVSLPLFFFSFPSFFF